MKPTNTSKLQTFLLILSIFLLIFVILLISRNIKNKKETKPYNLILISVDTLRADHMGVYGYQKNTTPYIDKWAKEAFVFKNAYSLLPVTYPSISTLMSGLNPFSTLIVDNNTYENKEKLPLIGNTKIILASILKENNYQTAAYIAHPYLIPKLTGLNIGFDKYSNYTDMIFRKKDKYEAFIENALVWLVNHKDNKFFLWIHLIDPHSPYDPPDDLKCKFNSKYCDVILPKTNYDLETKRNALEGWENGCRTQDLPQDQVEMYKTLYDGNVAYTDRVFQTINEKIGQLKLDDNTIVVLYGDHGEGFDHQYYFTHGGVLYNSSVHIPLIIKYPQAKSGNKIIDRLIDNSDILPTILDLLKIKSNNFKFDGVSFAGDFIGKSSLQSNISIKKNIILANDLLNKYAILDGSYKFIYSIGKSCLYNNQKEELYDITSDPEEKNNIIIEKNYISKLLKTQLLDYLSLNNQSNGWKDKIDRVRSLGY